MSEAKTVIHEPERIRALAHPLRLQLLDLLGEHGELTATECAEHTGESVASCSFHLRMLEKYGYIERAEPRGREKPWKRAERGFRTEADPEFPETVRASSELAVLSATHRVEQFRRAAQSSDRESAEWLDASHVSNIGFWATAEEMAAIAEAVDEVLSRHIGRSPSERPEGARFVHSLSLLYTDPLADS